jgi:succinate dehydrogenase / fumarate reductase cytochrome b subunit
MAARARPLSPHLQVYRLPLVAIMSITHRITGLGLAIGTILLAVWLGGGAYSPKAYAAVSGFLGSWLGYLLLFGWSVALYFHLCNGIRHLFWDVGKGFELPDARRANGIVLVSTVVLTAATWIAVVAR